MRILIDNGNTPAAPRPYIGHYGRLRKAYLEQYRPDLYTAIVNEYSHAMRSPFSVEAAGNSRASCCSFSRSCCSFHCLRFFSI